MSAPHAGRTPGVYRLDEDGTLRPVHAYLDEDYELADIVELLAIGTLDDAGGALALTGRERRLLKVTADAESFDHAPGFIRMCLDIATLDAPGDDAALRLVSVA